MTRAHVCAAWLAIVALLIDALLPSAVSAATRSADAGTPLALCGAATGAPLPGKPVPTLPARHCALCAAVFVGLLPSRQDGFAARLPAGAAHAVQPASAPAEGEPADYPAAQPRAPPRAA